MLEPFGRPVATGGLGLSAGANQRIGPLDSDRELALSPDGTQIYAVNSGDRSITVFGLASGGRLVRTAGPLFDTGGNNAVSVNFADTHTIAVAKEVAGTAAPSYAAFDTKTKTVQARAAMPIGASPSVAYVSRDAKLLFGTEFLDGARASQAPVRQIDAFVINANGTLTAAPGAPYALPPDTSGITPAPPAVALNMVEHPSADILYVGYPTRSQIGVYMIDRATGALTFVRAVPNSGKAVCWFLIDRDGRHMYTVNSGSATLSTYDLTDPTKPVETSSIALKKAIAGPPFVDANGATQTITSAPFQLAFDRDQTHIFVVSQRVTTNTTDVNGNYMHTLVVGSNGALTEPRPPLDLRELGVAPTARPQGVLLVTQP
jgi:DNA-binding beta-propeller fold protein YncE